MRFTTFGHHFYKLFGIAAFTAWTLSIAFMPASEAFGITRVYLLAGQSNMLGLGGSGAGDTAIPAPYGAAQTGVKIWSNSEASWVSLQQGFGYNSTAFGPEVGLGYTLNSFYPGDDIYLVKHALGSTNLAVNWKPETGDCYSTFKSTAKAALENLDAAGLSPVISGMAWMQGENDAGKSGCTTNAPAYESNLTNFINTVRSKNFSAFAVSDMPFVIGRITTLYDSSPTGMNAVVRAAQVKVADTIGNASWVDTDDMQINPIQPKHYGTQGQLDLGLSFANRLAPKVASAKTMTISDTTFNVEDWTGSAGLAASLTTVDVSGGGGSATKTITQLDDGGNKIMDVAISWPSGPSGVEVAAVSNKMSFSPSKMGTLDSISYSISEACAAGLYDLPWRMLVVQDGKYYVGMAVERGYTSPGQGNGFATYTGTDIISAEFCEITSDGTLGNRDTSSHPDFSQSGGDVYFGMAIYGSADVGVTYNTEFDDFSVTLNYTPAPEPSSLVLFAFAAVAFAVNKLRKCRG